MNNRYSLPASYSMLQRKFADSPVANIAGPFIKTDKILHLHACRQGPVLSNEIYLAIKEKQRNPELVEIIGLLHPFGTVSRHLNYWLSGLPSEVQSEIFVGLRLKDVAREGITEINTSVLNSLASRTYGDWETNARALLYPIIRHYQDELEALRFNKEDYENILASYMGDCDFQFIIVRVSELFANALLSRQNLPTIRIEIMLDEDCKPFGSEHVPIKAYNKNFERLLRRCKASYICDFNYLMKRLRGYDLRHLDEERYQKIISAIRLRRDSYLFSERMEYDVAMRSLTSGTPATAPTIGCYIITSISVEAFKKSIVRQTPTEESITYLTGNDMINLCFRYAHERSLLLALQDLMRDTDYSIYRELIRNNPAVRTTHSNCRIWDTSDFPEFDLNIVRGLGLLLKQKKNKKE